MNIYTCISPGRSVSRYPCDNLGLVFTCHGGEGVAWWSLFQDNSAPENESSSEYRTTTYTFSYPCRRALSRWRRMELVVPLAPLDVWTPFSILGICDAPRPLRCGCDCCILLGPGSLCRSRNNSWWVGTFQLPFKNQVKLRKRWVRPIKLNSWYSTFANTVERLAFTLRCLCNMYDDVILRVWKAGNNLINR